MLTVFTLCTGDKYDPEYVHVLKRMVERNLTIPHQFICVSDKPITGIRTRVRDDLYPGWWGKINILEYTGPSLWLDLDVVITGNIDSFIGTDKDMRVCKNWAQSGHGGVQSSIMYWEDARIVPETFDYDKYGCWPPSNNAPKLWGDQERLTVMRDNGSLAVDYFDPEQYKSYKYHLRNGLTEDCRVAIFHGKPDPHEVADEWVKQCRK